jgi:hypothetical protein
VTIVEDVATEGGYPIFDFIVGDREYDGERERAGDEFRIEEEVDNERCDGGFEQDVAEVPGSDGSGEVGGGSGEGRTRTGDESIGGMSLFSSGYQIGRVEQRVWMVKWW